MNERPRDHTELLLGPVDALRLSVLPHPGATLLSLVADALGDRNQGVPEHWRRAVREAAPDTARRVLQPLFAPDFSVIPDCLTPTASMAPDAAHTHLDRIADLSPEVLLAELEAEFGGVVPPQWRAVVDRPGPWLDAYARVLGAVWRAFQPTWRRGERLFRRETERVGAAVVGGGLDALLAGLNPRFRLDGTSLLMPDRQSARASLDGRRLTLVPIAAGTRASVFAFDQPDTVWIGYPLPGVGVLYGGSHGDAEAPPRAADTLGLVVGAVRASVLRATRAPLTMGDLAGLLQCTPATVTYHCAQLETAGLLERERRGRHVLVRRTERGDALVDTLT